MLTLVTDISFSQMHLKNMTSLNNKVGEKICMHLIQFLRYCAFFLYLDRICFKTLPSDIYSESFILYTQD